MDRKNHKNPIQKIGTVLFILWIISLATDVLGRYEYKEEFLMATIALWILGSFIDGLQERKGTGKALSTAFRKAGTTLFGIWILLWIFEFFDWLGPIWQGKLNYALGMSLICLAISFTIRASTIKNKNWRIRATFYSLGLLVILSWTLMKVFGLVTRYQDSVIIGSIILIALGYIIGASKNTHDYDYFEAKINNVSRLMKEVKGTPKASGDVRILTKRLVAGNESCVTVNKGAVLVDTKDGGDTVGCVFFGEGTYTMSSDVYRAKEKYMGICYATGGKWNEVPMETRPADDQDLKDIGLDKDDIIELSDIFVQEGNETAELLKDFKHKIRGSETDINLPFLRVLEGAEGDYVKFGPIEVADFKGKGARIRIGNREFIDGKEPGEDLRDMELGFKILTTKGAAMISLDESKRKLDSKELHFLADTNELRILKGDASFIRENGMQSISNDMMEISIEDYYLLRSVPKRIMVRLDNDSISIDYRGKHKVFVNKETSDIMRSLIDASLPKIVVDIMDGSMVTFNQLILQLTEEIEW